MSAVEPWGANPWGALKHDKLSKERKKIEDVLEELRPKTSRIKQRFERGDWKFEKITKIVLKHNN